MADNSLYRITKGARRYKDQSKVVRIYRIDVKI